MRRTVVDLFIRAGGAALAEGALAIPFAINGRFAGVVRCTLIGVPSSSAAIPDQPISLQIDRAAVGEIPGTHSETAAKPADLTGSGGVIWEIADLADLLPSEDEAPPGDEVTPDQLCTLTITHGAGFVGSVDYLGIRFSFETQ